MVICHLLMKKIMEWKSYDVDATPKNLELSSYFELTFEFLQNRIKSLSNAIIRESYVTNSPW